MLSDPTITAFLPSSKPPECKQFYQNVIGLQIVSEDEYAIEFTGNGTQLRITYVSSFQPHAFTVLGFKINKIESQVKSLSTKGVSFERYEHLNMDELGIWTSPSMAKVAWFKDPDGNLISLTEYPS